MRWAETLGSCCSFCAWLLWWSALVGLPCTAHLAMPIRVCVQTFHTTLISTWGKCSAVWTTSHISSPPLAHSLHPSIFLSPTLTPSVSLPLPMSLHQYGTEDPPVERWEMEWEHWFFRSDWFSGCWWCHNSVLVLMMSQLCIDDVPRYFQVQHVTQNPPYFKLI